MDIANCTRVNWSKKYLYMDVLLSHNVDREDTSEIHTAQEKEHDTLHGKPAHMIEDTVTLLIAVDHTLVNQL